MMIVTSKTCIWVLYIFAFIISTLCFANSHNSDSLDLTCAMIIECCNQNCALAKTLSRGGLTYFSEGWVGVNTFVLEVNKLINFKRYVTTHINTFQDTHITVKAILIWTSKQHVYETLVVRALWNFGIGTFWRKHHYFSPTS